MEKGFFTDRRHQPVALRPDRSRKPCAGDPGLPASLAVLCEHAVRTLPDSLGRRKTVLRALEKVLHAGHPAHRDVRAQLAGIDAVENLNARLQTRFDAN